MSEEGKIGKIRESIWEIQKRTLDLVQRIEENGGEVDEEQERRLAVLDLKRKDTVDNYRYTDITLDGEIQMLKAESRRFAQMAKTVEKLRKRLSDYVGEFMDANGIRKLEGTNSRITVKENPMRVEIDDEDAIIADFVRGYGEIISSLLPPWIKVEFKIDRTALKRLLTDGNAVVPEGVRLVNDYRIEIK